MATHSAHKPLNRAENDVEGGFEGPTTGTGMYTNPQMRCGIFCFTPKWLQVFANMRSFAAYYGVCSLMTSALTAYLTSQVTTLEKQYGLSSSETGLLLSMNDIGFLVFVLIISLFSRYANKPKILAICVLVFGLSAILSAVPHFATPDLPVSQIKGMNSSQDTQLVPRPSETVYGTILCSANSRISGERNGNLSSVMETTCSKLEVDNQSSAKFLALFLISTGMFLQGMAKAPRLPLTYSFIDDNVVKTKTGLFAGIIAFLAIFGPTMAYVVGARMSRIYVTLKETPFPRTDPRWVGAWWLGFVIFGSAAIVLSGPLFMFPRKIKITSRNPCRQQEARKEQHQRALKKRTACQQIKDTPRAFWRLLTNFNFMSIMIAGCLDMLTTAGGLSFAPKYLEVFFGISVFKANMLQGTTTFVACAIGMLAGGILVSKLRLTLKGCLALVVVVRLISGICSAVPLMLNCPQVKVEGLSGVRPVQTFTGSDGLHPSCADCSCSKSAYFPVCGSDGRNYFSPCVAGCSAKVGFQYTNCSCVSMPTNPTWTPQRGIHEGSEPTAEPGLCPAECGYLTVFVVTQTLSSFTVSLSPMPLVVAVMRSVEDGDKTLSIGVMSFLYSLIGWMLGPVVFGRLVDGACILWDTSCLKRGSCALYDIHALRDQLQGTILGGRATSVIIFTLCLARLVFFKKDLNKGDNTKPDERRASEEMAAMLHGN